MKLQALALIVSLLAFSCPSSAQSLDPFAHAGMFHFTLGLYAGAAVLDARITIECVRAGSCQEANPVYRPIVEKHGIEAAMGGKLAVQAGLAAGLIALRQKHPHTAGLILAALTALQIAVDVRNEATLERSRRRGGP